ncbi:MAG TPA: response regulator [Thermoanaerobaculia bacterium]|nr:response regulator [Thermoanaerobaculia bacterium]
MIRALIADDEAPARRKLRELLARETDFALAGEAADGVEAVEQIRTATPDVVFLDVQMPRLDGFGVIAEVGVEAMPLVVFVTAYDEHALRAFEVHALDYLLKPFAPSRFQKLIDRIRRQLGAESPETGDLAQRIEKMLAAVRPAPGYLRQILAERDENRQVLLAADEIDVIRADGNYLRFTTRDGEYRRRGTLRDLEDRLDPARFLRLSRSEIVRLDAIREVQPWFHGDARVVLRSGTVLTWSRRYRSKAEGLF